MNIRLIPYAISTFLIKDYNRLLVLGPTRQILKRDAMVNNTYQGNMNCAPVNKRVLYFDLLNIFATIAVVYLHCNGIVHTYTKGMSWAASLIIEVIFYWAVPIFFMLTGAKTLNFRAKRDTFTFLKSRMARIFFPFLAWSVILFIFRFSGLIIPASPNMPFTLRGFISALMTNTIEPTYWFFFSMFAVTISIPVLSLLVDQKKTLWYMVGCAFLFVSVAPYLFYFIGLPWNADITISVASGYIMYVILGWLLADVDFNLSKQQLKLLYCAGISCLALRYGYTYLSSTSTGQVDRLFFNYMSFLAVIPSVSLFMWFKNNELRFSRFVKHRKLIATISGASFGVYLIHKLVLDNFVCGFLGIPMDSIPLRTVGPLVIYVACTLIVLLLKRIPYIETIVP